MSQVRREEIVDFETYREERPVFRPKVIAVKDARRIHVGPLTFLFENHDTIRYQVQEMMLAERIVKEADVRHELATYNELLGKPGELGATLLIEIESAKERDVKLVEWMGLPAKLYAKLEDGSKAFATFDDRQVGETRLSSVHYLKFDVKGRVPVALGCEHPGLKIEAPLSASQRVALAEDLKG